MSAEIVPFQPRVTTDEYFGGCPECGEYDACLDVGPNHWFCCQTHRTKWCVGSNLFSAWREQTDAQRLANERQLAGFRLVEPVYPMPTAEELENRKREERRREQGKKSSELVCRLRALSRDYADDQPFAATMDAATALILAHGSLIVQCGEEFLSADAHGRLMIAGSFFDAFDSDEPGPEAA